MSRIAGVLRDAGLPYMVIGGQAVAHHGEPRFTDDVDITIHLHPDQAGALLQLINEMYVIVTIDDPLAFAQRNHVLPCHAADGSTDVDFVFTDTAYEQLAIQRGEDVSIGSTTVRFISAADLVVHKIVAGRPRDIEDATNILLKNPDIDFNDVRHWLGQFAEATEQPLMQRLDEMLSKIYK